MVYLNCGEQYFYKKLIEVLNWEKAFDVAMVTPEEFKAIFLQEIHKQIEHVTELEPIIAELIMDSVMVEIHGKEDAEIDCLDVSRRYEFARKQGLLESEILEPEKTEDDEIDF